MAGADADDPPISSTGDVDAAAADSEESGNGLKEKLSGLFLQVQQVEQHTCMVLAYLNVPLQVVAV